MPEIPFEKRKRSLRGAFKAQNVLWEEKTVIERRLQSPKRPLKRGNSH
jgi:hypothetical protein